MGTGLAPHCARDAQAKARRKWHIPSIVVVKPRHLLIALKLLSLFRFMCYTVPPRTGGPHYGRFTVRRCAVSPDGVSGFDQRDARRVSAAGPALRSGVPGAYDGVAPRWETPDGPPIYRL